VFPLDTGAGLAAGQVLKASVKTTGSTCEGQIVALGDIKTRFCNSGSFNPADPARCKFGSVKATIDGETTTYLPVEVVVSPETVNVKCDPKKDNGSVSFTILGNQSVDVTQIDPDSLELEGVQVSSCGDATFVNSDGFLDLSCTVRSCPLLGPAVKAAIIPGTKTATIQVTGSLKDSGTEIFGEDTVKTSP
jgi:hypothetical protein